MFSIMCPLKYYTVASRLCETFPALFLPYKEQDLEVIPGKSQCR